MEKAILDTLCWITIGIPPIFLIWRLNRLGLLLGTLFCWGAGVFWSFVHYSSWYYHRYEYPQLPRTQFDEGPLLVIMSGWFYAGIYCLFWLIGLKLIRRII
jgi:hypothetical protein